MEKQLAISVWRSGVALAAIRRGHKMPPQLTFVALPNIHLGYHRI